jgi:ParB-like chromosome segregation protein Spo0J
VGGSNPARRGASKQRSLPLERNDAAASVESLARQLAQAIEAQPTLALRVDALNRAREMLHEVSPFKSEPVDLVRWVPAESMLANDYNPNTVAPPEMELLRVSIESDGYTQPIVSYHHCANDDAPEQNEVVDGFHRHRVGREVEAVRERIHGYLPITRINSTRAARADRMAATIRHNRARGTHQVGSMSNIVRMMHLAGWEDDKISAELGMGADEVLRLKQITGLAGLFAGREYSEAWEAEFSETTSTDSLRRDQGERPR